MIKWNINSGRKNKIGAVFTDVKLCEACINDFDTFQRYLELLEDGQEKDKNFPADVQRKIINGISKMNWDGYFDKVENI